MDLQQTLKQLIIEVKQLRHDLGKPTRVWLTPDDAADYANMSVEHIRRNIYSKELPSYNYGSDLMPRRLIHKDDLDAFIKQRPS